MKDLSEQDFLNILTAVNGEKPNYEMLLHIIALYYMDRGNQYIKDRKDPEGDEYFHKGEKIIKYMDVFKMLNKD